MKKNNLKKYVAILLVALMAINTNIPAFAQNNYDSTATQSENAPSGSVIITENGVTINGVYYTKAEFTILLNQAVEVSNSEDNGIQTRSPIVAGVYFIPGIGEVAIMATGVIIVAGVVVVAGTWLYNTITEWLSNSQARTIAKIRAKIPSRLRKENGDVDLGKFNKKVGRKSSYKEKDGWTIEKDTGAHGGRKWKLKDKAGKRVASLGENGKVLAK